MLLKTERKIRGLALSAASLNETAKTSSAPPSKRQWLRFVTAASLFDGHDAAINIMRRILQSSGAEVIHLAHNRSVQDIVEAAIQEDVDAIAISSYQGGHIEYFKYLVDRLREMGADHIKIFGGGGGVIIPAEIEELHNYGVSRIYSPNDGQAIGLQGMIDDMLNRCSGGKSRPAAPDLTQLDEGDRLVLTRVITGIENEEYADQELQTLKQQASTRLNTPILGITGTGGAGKSSSTDEIIRRFRQDSSDSLKIAVLAIDPTRKKTGGALLGDRIRMNAIGHPNIFMRSVATRDSSVEIPERLSEIVAAIKVSGFDLIIIETPGIGQGDAGIVPFVDTSLYVMTPEFGAASQLEKIDMLDYADVFAINKFDRKGSEDALRDVCKQVQRNREAFTQMPDEMPVFGTIASKFNDDGITALYQALVPLLHSHGLPNYEQAIAAINGKKSTQTSLIIPAQQQRYLAEIAEIVRDYHERVQTQSQLARERQQLIASKSMLDLNSKDSSVLDELIAAKDNAMDEKAKRLLDAWPQLKSDYAKDEYVVKVRDSELHTALFRTSLSGTKISRVALPNYQDHGQLLQWLLLENVPGRFPFTAGVFRFKRESEDPTRMFAGEGDAFRTNRRFKQLSEHSAAKRLSTAFDSVTLYGFDPAMQPDIYGKVGNSGVSIATLDDMKELYKGFDLASPTTSVSMTINGPAPTILAMYMNAAIDQQLDQFRSENGTAPNDDQYRTIKALALENVRGTVQADILKEDQGQNTCIFSTEFSLKLMGDIQEYFSANKIRNFYSVSISGYHIAEAGANPISQLAFTLSNGFTFVEAYIARGMKVDDFAHNLSFFFSNGMDPEYTVLGRVARRIWSTAMRFKYNASEESQKLKYHIQTSGRSLHAQEMSFNDIRTTLQALIAVYDNCNSLHTNAYDEAVTTPTEESVRRAMAIQLIINKEWGLAVNENSNQGSFIIEELTDLVEEAVLQEFERISERGGVLGAMETGYQRGKIQDESMLYEHRKHDGSLPLIGVNTFLNPEPESQPKIELARSTDEEKRSQINRLAEFKARNADDSAQALERLRAAAINNENVFEELMNAVRFCSLGQITDTFFEVGGQYRRNM
ncbi:MAG: methylmalonyl-CoA mutase family protein [Gammaproteobacteria bacterium]|nr:methylmalonyl-CoA mutase family protein [Gammaproteobacteria bacterium]